MQVIEDPRELAASTGGAFVPTMGALHEGHLSLVRQAAGLARPLVISIFVNPTQFGPGEDYQRYPRSLDDDVRAAETVGVDVVFAPGVETIYPPGEEVPVPPLAAVATRPGLEDAYRPGHFPGVCQVVARLFDLVRPSVALFGEKDYQQLLVVEAMVEQEGPRWPGLRIVRGPTVRERGGLALSSRNQHLGADQRERARGLYRALEVAEQAAGSRFSPAVAEAQMIEVFRELDLDADYAVVRDARTLEPIDCFERPARALVAARVGDVRLIDNRAISHQCPCARL
jgi:pantoate--beta-alanine ligase